MLISIYTYLRFISIKFNNFSVASLGHPFRSSITPHEPVISKTFKNIATVYIVVVNYQIATAKNYIEIFPTLKNTILVEFDI